MILYIGPGVSLAAIVIVGIVLALVVASLAIVVWRPVRRLGSMLKKLFRGE